MNWDNHDGSNMFYGEIPLDLDSPPKTGDIVKLTQGEYEFDVEITSTKEEIFTGKVIAIGPEASLESGDIKRGQQVQFNKIHIQILNRNNVTKP